MGNLIIETQIKIGRLKDYRCFCYRITVHQMVLPRSLRLNFLLGTEKKKASSAYLVLLETMKGSEVWLVTLSKLAKTKTHV